MTGDDDEDDLAGGRPLPPEDRLWRHPSEMGRFGPIGTNHPAPRYPLPSEMLPLLPPPSTRPTARRLALIITSAGLGAVSVVGVLLAVGAFDSSPPPNDRPVVRVEEASSPVDPAVAAQQALVSVVRIEVSSGLDSQRGSAVVIRDDGLAYTTAGLVAGATKVSAVDRDGVRLEVEIIGVDPDTDVAVIALSGAEFTPILLGRAGDLAVGQRIIAVSPARSEFTAPSISTGVVEALEVDAPVKDGRHLFGLVQASNGPGTYPPGSILLDDRGAVVGLVSGDAPRGPAIGSIAASGSMSGEARAVPIETVRAIADRLLKDGSITHPYLGLTVADHPRGALITDVASGSPAEAAGMQVGDIVETVGGREVHSPSQLMAETRSRHVGDGLEITYRRDGESALCTPILSTPLT